jgi:hypothetical protein
MDEPGDGVEELDFLQDAKSAPAATILKRICFINFILSVILK